MLRVFHGWWLLVAICAALAPRSADAQDLGNCKTSKQWTIDSLTKDHWKLIGQVEVNCGDQTFSADEIEGFNDTHRMIATGNVVFTSGGNRIAADRMEYNTATKTGTFFNATGTATLKDQTQSQKQPTPQPLERSMFGTQEPDVYFYGEKISKVAREKYRISNGGFTTCVQPTPRWQLTSGTVILNLERYAFLTNSSLPREERPGVLSAGLLLSDQQGGPVDGLPDPDVRLVHDSRPDAEQRVFLGHQSQPGRDVLPRLVSRRPARAMDPSTGTSRRPDRMATSSSTTCASTPPSTPNDDGNVTTTPERTSYQVQGSLSQRISRDLSRARSRRLLLRHHRPADVPAERVQRLTAPARRERIAQLASSGAGT